MILAGTSATAGVLIRYLPAHMVYRTPDMQRIYDGFLPHATGATIREVHVPLIQIPTMNEVMSGNATPRQDADAPGDRFRVYEFAGMAHVDTRDNVRFELNPCRYPLNTFPLQAYVSVALHHLFEWADKGTVPPRFPEFLSTATSRTTVPCWRSMSTETPGGGIRNPYVDVPKAKHAARREAVDPLIPNPSAWVAARGQSGANQMCRLGGYEIAFSQEQLKALYGDTATYRSKVERRLDELEAAGSSLPVYRERILADATNVGF